MESESIELKGHNNHEDDANNNNNNTTTSTTKRSTIIIEGERNQNIYNPLFTHLAGAHWALSGDLQEIRNKWETIKITSSSSGSPIVIEDSIRTKVINNKTNIPPSSPPNIAKQRIRRGRTISSNGTRGNSYSPPRSASPSKADNKDDGVATETLNGLEAYGISLEGNTNTNLTAYMNANNREIKSRGNNYHYYYFKTITNIYNYVGSSRGASRNSNSRGASRPTSTNNTNNNPRAWSATSATTNTNNNDNIKNVNVDNTTSFKLRPLTAPKTEKVVMFHDDIDDESSVISGNILNMEVGYRRPTTATTTTATTTTTTNGLVLVGSQHIRPKS